MNPPLLPSRPTNSVFPRERSGRARGLEPLVCCSLGLVLFACTEPQFRDLDGAVLEDERRDAEPLPIRDSATPQLDGSDSDDSVFESDAGGESLAELMKSMVGKYYLRTFFNANEASKPRTTGLSLVEIKLVKGVLRMMEKPCYYSGFSMPFGANAFTELDATEVPAIEYELTHDGTSFESDQPILALGYDLSPPGGCATSSTLPTNDSDKPWLYNQPCACPADPTTLPPSHDVKDCRINDVDKDSQPGVTLYARVEDYLPVGMYVVQYSRDHYLHMHYKNAQRDILLAEFESTRTPSLLGCDPTATVCTLNQVVACSSEHSSAEFVRFTPGSSDLEWTCASLRNAAALTDTFRELPPENCYGRP